MFGLFPLQVTQLLATTLSSNLIIESIKWRLIFFRKHFITKDYEN